MKTFVYYLSLIYLIIMYIISIFSEKWLVNLAGFTVAIVELIT